MTQRVVYDADGNEVPVVGLIDHLDAAARLARIAELAVRIRTSGDAGQVDADALEIKRLAEGAEAGK